MMILYQFLKLTGYSISDAVTELSSIHNLDAIGYSNWYERKKWDIFDWHKNNNLFYTNILNNKMINSWTDVPILQKKDFQKDIATILAHTYSKSDSYISNTSGSSGHPFYFAKDKYAHAITWAEVFYLYGLHDIRIQDKQARFYGIPLNKLSYYKERIKDYIGNRYRFPVFDLSEQKMNTWLEVFKQKKFGYCYGYTSAMVFFARYCIQQSCVLKNICPSLKACITTSETCTQEDREILEKGFGVPVINEYGASETGIIAFDYPDGQFRISSNSLYVEVVDENDQVLPYGNEGRILVTSLFNKAMPIIRYEIGDIGSIRMDDHGHLILEGLQGRVNDIVQLPSGKKSAGLTFYYISRSILEQGGSLKEFIIRQTAIDTFEFDIVSDAAISAKDIQSIKNEMDVYLEKGLNLKVNYVDKIQRTGSGKIKHFFSEIKTQ